MTPDQHAHKWRGLLDERQNAEINFSELYADAFHHGTDGHNAKMLIAKLAKMLNAVELSGVDISSVSRDEYTAKPDHVTAQFREWHAALPQDIRAYYDDPNSYNSTRRFIYGLTPQHYGYTRDQISLQELGVELTPYTVMIMPPIESGATTYQIVPDFRTTSIDEWVSSDIKVKDAPLSPRQISEAAPWIIFRDTATSQRAMPDSADDEDFGHPI